MRAIITVIGQDRIGIIAGISSILAETGVNILDISQTTMQDIFTMIMLVDIKNSKAKFTELAQMLDEAGEKLGVLVKIQHEDIFNSMHRI